MRSKIIFISLVVFICSFASACSTNTASLISSIRTYSEYNNLSREEQEKVISSFDKILESVLKEEVFQLTKEYLSNNCLDDFEIKNIELIKNNLLLSSAENRKVRCNGILYIDFMVNNSNYKFDEESVRQLMKEFFEFTSKNSVLKRDLHG